jgi:hypothetical protein
LKRVRAILDPAEREQLSKLGELPEDQIDTADIPEAPPENWVHAKRPGQHVMEAEKPHS